MVLLFFSFFGESFFTLATLCARCAENRGCFEAAFPHKGAAIVVAAARLLADRAGDNDLVLERTYAVAFLARFVFSNQLFLFTLPYDLILHYSYVLGSHSLSHTHTHTHSFLTQHGA